MPGRRAARGWNACGQHADDGSGVAQSRGARLDASATHRCVFPRMRPITWVSPIAGGSPNVRMPIWLSSTGICSCNASSSKGTRLTSRMLDEAREAPVGNRTPACARRRSVRCARRQSARRSAAVDADDRARQLRSRRAVCCVSRDGPPRPAGDVAADVAGHAVPGAASLRRPRIADVLAIRAESRSAGSDALFRAGGARTVAFVNDAASPLADAAQWVFDLRAGPEASIAATKSYIAQLVAGARVVAAWQGDPVLQTALECIANAARTRRGARLAGRRRPPRRRGPPARDQPWPRSADCARGRAQAQGGLRHPGGSVFRSRASARSDGAHRARLSDYRIGAPRSGTIRLARAGR